MASSRRWAAFVVASFALLGCQSSDDEDDDGAGVGASPCDGDGEGATVAGITDAHNALRAAVNQGDPLPPLVWSCDLATVAQAYANELARGGCALEHSDNDYGENLFSSSNSADVDRVVGAWAEERACYSYGEFPDQCTPVAGQCQTCGHYTQMVWRNSRELGCGVAHCGDGDVWVCNYDPPGNFLGEYPY